MKLMNSAFILRMAILSFFLSGLSFLSTTDQLTAQTSSTMDQFYSIPQEVFVTPAEAIVRLDNALTPIKLSMEVLQTGTPQYRVAAAKYQCFNATQNFIVDGKGVAESIVDGLRSVGTDEFELEKGTHQAFRTEIINLLKI